jgi:nicotinate-nucleotide adenylyltransferase
MANRIGIFPGTFDPIHRGHISFALEVKQHCRLDKVILLPESVPREKSNVSDIIHREALINKAIAGTKGLESIVLNSKQFTVSETIPELKSLYKKTNFTLLLGSDSVRTFTYRWEGLELLLSEMSLAIGLRAGDSKSEILEIISKLEKKYSLVINYTIIIGPNADMSSSQIRNKQYGVELDPEISEYIQSHGLYES